MAQALSLLFWVLFFFLDAVAKTAKTINIMKLLVYLSPKPSARAAVTGLQNCRIHQGVPGRSTAAHPRGFLLPSDPTIRVEQLDRLLDGLVVVERLPFFAADLPERELCDSTLLDPFGNLHRAGPRRMRTEQPVHPPGVWLKVIVDEPLDCFGSVAPNLLPALGLHEVPDESQTGPGIWQCASRTRCPPSSRAGFRYAVANG